MPSKSKEKMAEGANQMLGEQHGEKNDKKQDWIIQIRCPFCDALIVEAVDYHMVPKDMPDDEKEKIMCSGNHGGDKFGDYCEHVAFISDWGFDGSVLRKISNKWKKEMFILAKALHEKSNSSDNKPEEVIEYDLCNEKRDDFGELLKKNLPNYDSVVTREYVEKYADLTGGGPNYGVIFLRKKDS